MIIGFDAKRAFHNDRGLGNYSRDLIRIMHEYYPENDYRLFNPSPSNKTFLTKEILANQILPRGILYKSIPSLWRSFGICNDIKNFNIDLFHGLSQELPFGLKKMKTKSVVTFHDAIFMRYPELYDRFYREVFIRKNRYSLGVADKIIAISRQSKSDAINYFKVPEEKIEVVYQGCNQMFSQKVSDEDKEKIRIRFNLPETYILTVSALEERKNLKTLINSYSKSQKRLPLIIVGKNSTYAHELKKMVDGSGLATHIIFLHQVDNAELPAIYQSASLFVFPSVFEGFGIPILEALNSGVPVITSGGSCFEETGGDASVYVNPFSTDEMADAIDQVLDDSQLRFEMIRKGFLHAAYFSEEKIADRLMNFYKSVL